MVFWNRGGIIGLRVNIKQLIITMLKVAFRYRLFHFFECGPNRGQLFVSFFLAQATHLDRSLQ